MQRYNIFFKYNFFSSKIQKNPSPPQKIIKKIFIAHFGRFITQFGRFSQIFDYLQAKAQYFCGINFKNK